MEYAIKILEAERAAIVAALKDRQAERLAALQQLDKALNWLRVLEEKQVDKVSRYDVEALPYIEGRGGFTSYRVMIDNETDDTAMWEEYQKADGSHFLLSLGDLIITSK